MNAYKNNEVAANQQFKGKTLLVSATVSSIDAGISDEPYLTLKAGGEYEFNQPQAHLADAEQNKAASLSKGQKIKLLCTGNSEIAGTPMLDNCSIQ
ncbi:TRNA-anti-like protein [compost metagenome]